LLIAQDRAYITRYIGQPDDGWLREDIEGIDKDISLGSLKLSLSLGDIYDRVELQAQPA
jgi:hypothetical protein